MKRVNEYKFYELAAAIHPLTELPATGAHYNAIFFPWFQARQTLIQIFIERPLHVSRDSAFQLATAIDAVVPRNLLEAIQKIQTTDDLQVDPDKDAVELYRVNAVRESAKRFEMVLSAEAQVLDTYFIDQKGSYRTSDLIERAEIVLPESIRGLVPPTTIQDIQQAGRCVALDSPTSAGFHLMRAIEGVMALYYNRVLGKPIPTRMRNWSIYIKALRKSGSADEKIVGFLDHIRQQYRNPITHPDVVLSGDDAEVLLGVAISVIRQMIMEIQRISLEAIRALPAETPPLPARHEPIGGTD